MEYWILIETQTHNIQDMQDDKNDLFCFAGLCGEDSLDLVLWINNLKPKFEAQESHRTLCEICFPSAPQNE